MKVRQIVRGQLILAGLAAALFVTPAAHSQEISNATFDDGPYVTSFAQPDLAESPAQTAPAQAAVPSLNEVQSIQASLVMPKATMLDSPWVAAGLTMILFAAIALAAIAESKRVRRNSYSGRRYPSYRGA